MAITIRNKRIEDMIREIGRNTGEGPSAVVARAVEILNGRTFSEQESRDKLKHLMKDVPPRDPNLTWEDLQNEMDSIF